jgi:hypothetical protein
MAASVLMEHARLSVAEAAVWDALALLLDDGPQVLLSRVVDRATAVRVTPGVRVRRALLGRLGAEEDRLAAAVEEVFRTAVEVPAGGAAGVGGDRDRRSGRPASVRQAHPRPGCGRAG